MEWVEGVGNSIAEATEMALEALGVHEDDADIDVVNDVNVGLFNRVKEKARVRVRVKPTTPRAKDDRRRKRNRSGNGDGSKKARKSGSKASGAKNGSSKPSGGKGSSKGRQDSGKAENRDKTAGQKSGGRENRKRNGGRKAKDKPEDDNMDALTLIEQADIAEAFVTGLAAEFGESVTFERTEVDDREIRVVVSGKNLGRMIGRRGATAQAVDELVRTVLQRQAGGGRDGRVRVDIGGIADRREEALRAFCAKVAGQVRDTGKEIALEPMRGADRKIVHDAMSNEEGVQTTSEGEDPNRRVVVVPTGNDN